MATSKYMEMRIFWTQSRCLNNRQVQKWLVLVAGFTAFVYTHVLW